MTAPPRARDEVAGAETVGALLLFGIFVGVIAFLNVTAVPQAGLAGEEAHFTTTLGALNALQASAEAAALPGGAGTSVSEAIRLGPTQTGGTDFFSFFVATPAQASGEIIHNASYGNMTIFHYQDGSASPIYDVGSPSARFPVGQLAFDPHPVFRNAGIIALENGALLTTDGATQTLRHEPAITLSSASGVTHVSLKTRVLNGTGESIGGSGPARVSLTTQATTLVAPTAPNAMNVTMRLETQHGSAWGAYLNASAQAAGLAAGSGYSTTVSRGGGEGGLDIVTWRVEGAGTGNDIQFTSGLALLGVGLS